MAQLELPPKEDKVCANCKHLAWMIGIGQGLKCVHPKVYEAAFNTVPPTVPSSRHTCDKFKFKYPEDM